jgi:hypothetical protein
METEETKEKRQLEIRFRWMIFFLRSAGIPFKIKKISTLYFIYIVTVNICTGSMFLGLFVDAYIHRGDLGYVMTTIRLLSAATSIVWIYISCR